MNLITKQEDAMHKDRLEGLFQELRSEEPKLSFTDVSRRFLKAQHVGWFGVVLIRFFRKWNYLNWIIMTTSIITATALGILLSGAPEVTQKSKKQPTGIQETTPVTNPEAEETIEIEYFTADSQLVQRIKKAKGQVSIENIPPLVLKTLPDPEVHPLPVYPNTKDSTTEASKDRIFEITHNMQDVELQKIENAAKAAGLDFHYKYLAWKGKVKRIEYWINWTGTDGKYCNYHAVLKGKFATTVGWTEDANGKAIGLLE